MKTHNVEVHCRFSPKKHQQTPQTLAQIYTHYFKQLVPPGFSTKRRISTGVLIKNRTLVRKTVEIRDTASRTLVQTSGTATRYQPVEREGGEKLPVYCDCIRGRT